MKITAVVDTHTILWQLFNDPRLSRSAKAFLILAEQSGDQIAVSTMTMVEIVYLVEKGRIPNDSMHRLIKFLDQSKSPYVEVIINRAIASSMSKIPRSEVPDMPDRIIAATALHLGVPLISRDAKIRASSVTTVW